MTPPVQQVQQTAELTDIEVLWERLGRLEQRVREAVAARRAVDPDPDDSLPGAVPHPEAAARILETRDAFTPVPEYGDGAPARGSARRGRRRPAR